VVLECCRVKNVVKTLFDEDMQDSPRIWVGVLLELSGALQRYGYGLGNTTEPGLTSICATVDGQFKGCAVCNSVPF
jgi:hypothetical protein